MFKFFVLMLLLMGCSDDFKPVHYDSNIECDQEEKEKPQEEQEIVYTECDSYTMDYYNSVDTDSVYKVSDGNLYSVFSTSEVEYGDYVELVFNFNESINIDRIELFQYYTYEFSMGEVEIKVDSESIGVFNCLNTSISNGIVEISIGKELISEIRLRMTYNGQCCYGSSPSFYLSEIKFYKYEYF